MISSRCGHFGRFGAFEACGARDVEGQHYLGVTARRRPRRRYTQHPGSGYGPVEGIAAPAAFSQSENPSRVDKGVWAAFLCKRRLAG